MAPPIEFWFELASTYSYLAAMRIEADAAAAGRQVIWRPFLLGPIFKAISGVADSPFNLNPARGRYMWRDVERQAAALHLPFRKPSTFPRGSVLGTRVALLGEDEPWVGAFVRAVFRANFVDDRDISDDSVIVEIVRELALPHSLLERAREPGTKDRLRVRTADAQTRGIFGAPTFFVGDEMFWGNDRMDEALRSVAGDALTR